ncbi:hypothetical protein PgNI_05396 [Pyricularia grisea]|uniref:Uncharacterized protein n=1 Tax=Pyricularia grisea TaxID=148305 RepID=A0A6P8B6M4_PYRGI|nr:hypothetical protein PgNI_05396 [Pyricularia grisea]TLD10967.1 hypothetical protein PgNI_05396 [Pyricularia grisea]
MSMQLSRNRDLVCQVKLSVLEQRTAGDLFDIPAVAILVVTKMKGNDNGGRRGRSRQVVRAEGQEKRARKCVERRTVVLQRVRPAGSLFTSLGADVRYRRQIEAGLSHLTRIGIEQYNCGEGRRAKEDSGTFVLDGLLRDVANFAPFCSP